MPAPLSREANGTERITVVMTPAQKRTIQQRARHAGLTISDYIRRQALESEDLGPLLEQLRASTAQANRALDSVFSRLHTHVHDLSVAEAAARARAKRANAP
ncbi:hypothetical protein Xkhy_20790 [Xanthomonas axonopodis pv. khayae]|uniref:Uncharacterized protein n=1 Tax=Xanthomonas vasicola pv. vasculorum NCPPB 890 TaxID=1184265 RepID=A0A836P2B3_XANVA|nr:MULTISPECIES: hypothetical protein [Xanthomonas]MEB1776534.1 hypothetical protein [Xanthomonas campestris pv. campestris]KFA30167.1 hypothetical protein KW5_0105400 [Xanthomonas vasicola pv. vasculorum NCPPB 1326]KFA36931.1 hypothetical protein KWG_0100065 [Xanthomonas vasicola pv. vasculorum NCPPB 1381]MBV6748528.1 hypothetical protein [Xanthomonas vasicola pv. vasculorum NCPPB 890]MBV6894137.1 hypothetical protein [Xanthomonas vasicola pv. vasculorum]